MKQPKQSASELLIVLVTTPNHEVSLMIAQTLIEKHLASCVNILPNIHSIYRWEGNIEQGNEQLLIIKALQSVYPELQQQISSIHPYSTPEIVALSVSEVSEKYLAWVKAETTKSIFSTNTP